MAIIQYGTDYDIVWLPDGTLLVTNNTEVAQGDVVTLDYNPPVVPTVSTTLSATLAAAVTTETILTDLSGILGLFDVEVATQLSSILKTIDNTIQTLQTAVLQVTDNEVQSTLTADLLEINVAIAGLTATLERAIAVASNLRGYLAKDDVEVATLLTATIALEQTITITSDLTSYLSKLDNEESTNLRSTLETIDNEVSTQLTAALGLFDQLAATDLSGHINAVNLTTQPADLSAILQKLDNEVSTTLTSALLFSLTESTTLTANLASALLGEFTDLTAWLSKFGILTSTQLRAYLVESERFPHVCVAASPREKFKASPRHKFRSAPDRCPSDRGGN